MERLPKHLKEDPLLRRRMIAQESLDEFTAHMGGWLEHGDTTGIKATLESKGVSVQRFIEQQWQKTLDPATNLAETLYLRGMTDKTQRDAAIQQSHAQLREGLLAKGIVSPEVRNLGGVIGELERQFVNDGGENNE